ncbi:MAG TPA: hypothetical protein VL463_34485 [Kofleriaceae bacterium]|nr:hypothetical protein [Kofleriaceae bacterium]
MRTDDALHTARGADAESDGAGHAITVFRGGRRVNTVLPVRPELARRAGGIGIGVGIGVGIGIGIGIGALERTLRSGRTGQEGEIRERAIDLIDGRA